MDFQQLGLKTNLQSTAISSGKLSIAQLANSLVLYY